MTRAARLRKKRSQQKLVPSQIASLVTTSPRLPEIGDRCHIRRSDPIFGGKAGRIIDLWQEHGGTMLRLELDAVGGRTRVRLRKFLADVILLEDWQTRRPRPAVEPDTNVYATVFG